MPNLHQFINMDLIAAGLSPFAPETDTVQAGRLMLCQIDKCIQAGENFCVETTLAGCGYIQKISTWKKSGYAVHLMFLSLPSVEMAISRLAYRVKQGGHSIPDDVVQRRFHRGLENFYASYKQIVDTWMLFDNSGSKPVSLAQGKNGIKGIPHEHLHEFSAEDIEHFRKVTKALEQAALEARKIAIQTKTPLIVYDKEKGIQEVWPSANPQKDTHYTDSV